MAAAYPSWANSYARQALSDLDAREALATAGAKKCHRLHFLQMAAEKTCKAYWLDCTGPDQEIRSHALIEKVLPSIARAIYARTNHQSKMAQWEISEVKKFSREIKLLSPACDDSGTRPDNTEYPWQDSQGKLCVPCDYNFPNLDDNNRDIIKLIKLIRIAAESYSR